jgi:glycosyltransferase involved in cell wall biosynthesis
MTCSRAPLVSIIIPCYNRAEYLGDTIESALAQHYPAVEVTVVDDGSTDDSPAVAARYPVRLVRQLNHGVAAAMNAGIAASKGQFLSTLGSDDLMHPSYIEACMSALRQDPDAAFAYTQMIMFGAVNRLYPVREFDPETLAENDYIPAAFVMRRAAFDVAGPFDTRIVRCEDWDLLLGMAEREMRGVFVRRPLFFYRQHQRSYNSRDFLSLRGLRRELAMAARLQDRHPVLLDRRALVRRLLRVPTRLLKRDISGHHAVLLFAFYGAMLTRPSSCRMVGLEG